MKRYVMRYCLILAGRQISTLGYQISNGLERYSLYPSTLDCTQTVYLDVLPVPNSESVNGAYTEQGLQNGYKLSTTYVAIKA